MNIFLISVSAISTTLCGTETCATDTKAPESIAGAAIKLNEAIYSPSDITIERYEPDKNTARLIMRYSKQLMPRISEAASLTGAATTEGVHEEKVKPALVTFTGQKAVFIREPYRVPFIAPLFTEARKTRKSPF